jgi:hypothetical protein
MGEQQKWRPEDGWANGEVIVEMSGAGSKEGAGLAIFIETQLAKARVGGLIVPRKIEIVLDEWSARKSVVADAITANPGIEERKKKQKQNQKDAFGVARTLRRLEIQTVLFHELVIRENVSHASGQSSLEQHAISGKENQAAFE